MSLQGTCISGLHFPFDSVSTDVRISVGAAPSLRVRMFSRTPNCSLRSFWLLWTRTGLTWSVRGYVYKESPKMKGRG